MVLLNKATLQKKNVIAEEELDYIDIDDIGNLEDSLRLVFIDEKCENLMVVNAVGERTTNINQKTKQAFLIGTPGSENRCPLSEKCYRRAYFFSNHVEYLL